MKEARGLFWLLGLLTMAYAIIATELVWPLWGATSIEELLKGG